MKDLTPEKIKTRIRENLRRGREQFAEPGKARDFSRDERHSAAPHGYATGERQPDTRSTAGSLLWKYGLQYAKIIKKIPVLRNIAEKFYWRLAYRSVSSHSSPLSSGAIDLTSGYNRFLDQLRREGLKGKVKLSIFRIIGFFAWWQEQINASFIRELSAQKAAMEDIVKTQKAAMEDIVNTQRAAVGDIAGRLNALSQIDDAFHQELVAHKAAFDERSRTIDSLRDELNDTRRVLRDLKRDLAGVTRRLELQGRELNKEEVTYISRALKGTAPQELPLYDHAYVAFEDRFRGSRELIKERQSQYIGFIQKAYEESKGDYLLDIGCGRGELLELLAGSGIPSKGIDLSAESVRICTEHGMNAKQADALQFLGGVKNDSLIGVTAIQVVEHLMTDYLAELIKLAYQKTKPGGVIILETVNPFSIFSLRNFFIDLTHNKPIPQDTLKFLVEASGFVDTSVHFSSPVTDELKLSGDDENTKKLNELLFSFQDYAIIGWK